MSGLSLTDGVSRLELDLASWDGDAYLTVSVDSRGFAGRNDLHVLGHDFTRFCADLLELQRTLKGEARVVAVHPSELDVHIRRADGLGHIAVSGTTGYHVQIAHASYWHAVHFGFQIEPNQLDSAVRGSWVQQYGGGSSRVGA